MINNDERRWRQRFESYSSTLTRLDEACDQDSYTNLELAGLVKTFEFSFELGWKVLKDLLHYEGHDLNSPHEAIHKSFESGYIGKDDFATVLDALGSRHWLTQMYDDRSVKHAEMLIKRNYHPMLRRLRRKLEQKRSE